VARRVRRFSAFAAANVALPLNTETVVATISGVLGEFPDGHVALVGTVAALGAAGTTGVALNVRRGGLGGANVGEVSNTVVTGAVNGTCSIAVEEDFAGGAPPVYVLTATIAGAAGTATQADLLALVT
jgi:hypothetical protein